MSETLLLELGSFCLGGPTGYVTPEGGGRGSGWPSSTKKRLGAMVPYKAQAKTFRPPSSSKPTPAPTHVQRADGSGEGDRRAEPTETTELKEFRLHPTHLPSGTPSLVPRVFLAQETSCTCTFMPEPSHRLSPAMPRPTVSVCLSKSYSPCRHPSDSTLSKKSPPTLRTGNNCHPFAVPLGLW